jgi:hypothetical protein
MPASVLAFLFSIALAAASCSGDGKIFRRSAEPAPMPAQTAVLTWVDGVQTLVIQTRFESRSQAEAAWVVPAPSVPEVFEVEPGVIESARAQFNPRVERSPSLVHPALVVVGLWLVGGLHLVFAAKGTTAEKLACFVVLVCVSFVTLDVGTARTRGLSASGAPKVDVLKVERVGSYDVAVISSPDASALRDWLMEFGVTISPRETSVIETYAKEGWCFVASKLRTATESIATPHPLSLRFLTGEPVYPMRLTGVGNQAEGENTPLDLELLVYGAGTASVPGMKAVASGPLERDPDKWLWRGDDRIALAHEGVRSLTSDASWGTRLVGSFPPEAMRRDLRIAFGHGSILGRTVVDRADKPVMLSVACGVAIVCVGVITLPITWGRRWSLQRAGAVMTAGFGVAFILSLISLGSVTFVRTQVDQSIGLDRRYEHAWWEVAMGYDVIASVDDARRAYERAWKDYAGPDEPVPGFGRGPGEYTISERGGEYEFRWVNGNGRESVQPFMAIGARTPGNGTESRPK